VLRRWSSSTVVVEVVLAQHEQPVNQTEHACGHELHQDALARGYIDIEQSRCLAERQIQPRHRVVLGQDTVLKTVIAEIARRAPLQVG
jgi:hypothetical protein